MPHTDLLTPTQLGFDIDTSDVVQYDGSTLTTISLPAAASLNDVILAIDTKSTDLQSQITAIGVPVDKTSDITTYDGTPTFTCFAFVGTSLNAIIDELGLQICINNTAIGALNTTDISTGAATPLFNAAPYPVGPAVSNTDEALIAIDAAILTFDTDKLDEADAIEVWDAAFSSFIMSGTVPAVGAGPFDVDIPQTIFYRAGTILSPGGKETVAPATIVVTASKDNYIDRNLVTDAYVIISVANSAPEPAVPANSVRVVLAITDGAGIVSIVNIADTDSISSDNIKDKAVNTEHLQDGSVTDPKLVVSGVTPGTFDFANITVTDKGIVTAASSEVTFTALADEDFLQFDSGSSKWVNVALLGAILPSGASNGDVLTFNTATTAWEPVAPIAFTAIPLAGTGAPITGDLEFGAGIKIFRATSSLTLNTNDITIDGDNFNVTATDSLIDAETTFTANMILTESVAPASPTTNGVVLYAADRAAIAGTTGLNIVTEDDTKHIFSDIVGIGTLTPDASSAMEVSSTTGGFLVPRMTRVQRDAISSPAAGLIIFNITDDQFNGRNSSDWVIIG